MQNITYKEKTIQNAARSVITIFVLLLFQNNVRNGSKTQYEIKIDIVIYAKAFWKSCAAKRRYFIPVFTLIH